MFIEIYLTTSEYYPNRILESVSDTLCFNKIEIREKKTLDRQTQIL